MTATLLRLFALLLTLVAVDLCRVAWADVTARKPQESNTDGC